MSKHSLVNLPYKSSTNSEEKINLADVGRPWNPVKRSMYRGQRLASALPWKTPGQVPTALRCLVSKHGTWHSHERTFAHSPLIWIWLSMKGRVGQGLLLEETQNICNSGLWQAHCLNSILPSHKHVQERVLTPKGAGCSPGLLQSKNSYTKGLTVLGPAALALHSPRNPLRCISFLA